MQMTLDLGAKKERTNNSKLLRRQALNCLKANPQGLTADEIAELIGRNWWSVRPRMTELKDRGHLIRTGIKRRNDTGGLATVWRAR